MLLQTAYVISGKVVQISLQGACWSSLETQLDMLTLWQSQPSLEITSMRRVSVRVKMGDGSYCI